MQPDMIDDFMLCLVSDDNLYQGKILVNALKMKSQSWKKTFLGVVFQSLL